MALETLKGVEEIGGFNVFHADDYTDFIGSCHPGFIAINHKQNEITFRIQNGPIKENGVNGCQVLTMIQAAKLILEKLNEKFPCAENLKTITHLAMAIEWQQKRTKIRELRGVEGTNQA